MVEIGHVVLKEYIFEHRYHFQTMSLFTSFEKDIIHHYIFTEGGFVPSLIDFGLVVLEEKIYKRRIMFLHYFVIFSSVKKGKSFFKTDLGEFDPVVVEKKIKFRLSFLSILPNTATVT